ncbi:MAG: phosphoribosyltransferase family protein [Microthrixaceae bacterium]
MDFRDRRDAGRRLAGLLERPSGERVVVLGLPRGGVPVAAEVAGALDAPLDVLVVRKLGVPSQPEYAMGAIGECDVRILDGDVIRSLQITDAQLARVEADERAELERRVRRYRGDRDSVPLLGCTAILVDDGMATGSTALAACQVARLLGAARVVIAVPVASAQAVAELRRHADEVVAVSISDRFRSVGQYYDDFDQTSDAEVVRLLRRHGGSRPDPQTVLDAVEAGGLRHQEVGIVDGRVTVAGRLTLPDVVRGVVLFAHGSGSSRNSLRNRAVAEELNRVGLATLLFDLLTPREAADRSNVFDIELLARRLLAGTGWVAAQPETSGVDIGYFGASTGAAAALLAAASSPVRIGAVVSRGGRPDLAGDALPRVGSPTLLVVGSRDVDVLGVNRLAAQQLRCEHRVAVVAGAGHLFEEPGTLDEAARLATDWFVHHLIGAPARGDR